MCDPLVRLLPLGLMLLPPGAPNRGRSSARHGRSADRVWVACTGAQSDVGLLTRIVAGVVGELISREPLENAAVFLWDAPYRGVSDVAGRYRIEGVPEGDYSLLFARGNSDLISALRTSSPSARIVLPAWYPFELRRAATLSRPRHAFRTRSRSDLHAYEDAGGGRAARTALRARAQNSGVGGARRGVRLLAWGFEQVPGLRRG